MNKKTSKSKNWIQYYDDRNMLDEITHEPADPVLDEHSHETILSGERKRKLKHRFEASQIIISLRLRTWILCQLFFFCVQCSRKDCD